MAPPLPPSPYPDAPLPGRRPVPVEGLAERVLHLMGSATPAVRDIAAVVERAQADGWAVCLGLTPTAADWLAPYLPGLEALTGYQVRSRFDPPGTPEPWPPADVLLMAPASFHTFNRWALGLTGSLVVHGACAAVARRVPSVAVPCADPALAGHPQFGRSVAMLRGAGVRVLLDEAERPADPSAPFPWSAALAAAAEAYGAAAA